jgi:hypothetical protein
MVNKVTFDAVLKHVCVLVLASIIFMNFPGLFKFLPPADANAQIADASGQHSTSVTGHEGTYFQRKNHPFSKKTLRTHVVLQTLGRLSK